MQKSESGTRDRLSLKIDASFPQFASIIGVIREGRLSDSTTHLFIPWTSFLCIREAPEFKESKIPGFSE